MDIRKLQRAIVDGLEDVKAQDIAVFNTEHLSPLFERVIIATGSSNRQTKSLATSVRTSVKDAGFPVPRVEGEENGEWIIVDCGAAVVHIMQPAIRQYYQLEEIWGEKPVAIKTKAKAGLVKASEPEDEAPAKPKKAAGKTTPARKAAPPRLRARRLRPRRPRPPSRWRQRRSLPRRLLPRRSPARPRPAPRLPARPQLPSLWPPRRLSARRSP